MGSCSKVDIPFGLALDNKVVRLEANIEVTRVAPEALPKRSARPSVMSDTEMEVNRRYKILPILNSISPLYAVSLTCVL